MRKLFYTAFMCEVCDMDKKMYGVLSRNRTVWYDRSITLRDVQIDLKSRDLVLNLTQTLQSYGLHFNDERSFSVRYREEFSLKGGKTMWDITLRELDLYRELLLGVEVIR